MKSTDVIHPTPISAPIAYSGLKFDIPEGPTGSGLASIAEGFPEITMKSLADGGLPPRGQDCNGMFYLSTDQRTYLQNGGIITFEQEVSDLIGGYPKGAVLDFISSNGTYQKVMSLVDDNTNNFVEDESLIDEINWRKILLNGNGTGLPIGAIYPMICSSGYVPYGSLACDGSEYSKSQFLQLWENYLTGETTLLKTCTYEEYTEMVTTYGSCPMFGIDEDSLSFKVPLIKDGTFIQQAQTDEELGKAYNAGLPEIEGSFRARGFAAAVDMLLEPTVGAFSYSQEVSEAYSVYGATLTPGILKVNFKSSDSNAIYGNSVTVQPESVALRYFVVVSTGTINEAQVDWSEWATSLNSKADKDELDGVWVKKHKELLINVSCNGTTNLGIDLSDYLPSDNNAYELLLTGWAHFNGTAYQNVTCQINTSLGAAVIASFNNSVNQTASVGGCAIIPVDGDRVCELRRQSNTFGLVSLNVDAYRKIRS